MGENPPLEPPARRAGDTSGVILTFPIIGPGPRAWDLTQDHLGQLSSLYPGIDVLAELRIVRAKIDAGGVGKKTARGMERAVLTWLGYVADGRFPRAGRRSPQVPGRESAVEAELAEMKKEPGRSAS